MRLQHWILLIVLSLLWGAGFIFSKDALSALPPLTLTLLRCAIAAAVLLAAALALGHTLPRAAGAWRDFAVMAVLNNVIPFALIFTGQTMIPSGLASVANATTPLMTLLVARLVAGERLSRNKFVGVGLGIVGVAVLVGPSALVGDKASVLGTLLVIGGAFSYGCSGLWGRRFKATPPIITAAMQLSASTLMVLPIAALSDQFWRLPMPSAPIVASVLALSIMSTALAYILFFRIMAEAGSNNVMLVTLLIPISAIGIGAWHFGERLAPNQFAGAAIIAASLLVIDGRLFGAGGAAAAPKPTA